MPSARNIQKAHVKRMRKNAGIQRKQKEQKQVLIQETIKECKKQVCNESPQHNQRISSQHKKLCEQEAKEANFEREWAKENQKKTEEELHGLLKKISIHPEFLPYIRDIGWGRNPAYKVACMYCTNNSSRFESFIARTEQGYRRLMISTIKNGGVKLAQRALDVLDKTRKKNAYYAAAEPGPPRNMLYNKQIF